MEQNDNVRQKTLLESIQENTALLKQLTGKAQEKKQDITLVDQCIVAMHSNTAQKASDDQTEEISNTHYAKKNKAFLNPKQMIPEGICVYASGTVITASDLINNMFDVTYLSSDNIAVHAIINYEDGKIYQTLPWNYKGSHQFSKLDNSYIGIMICEANASSLHNDPMADTFNSLSNLVAWLCKKYNIPLNDKNIVLNNDSGQIKDINSYWQGYYSNQDFFSKVQSIMDTGITADKLKESYYAQ